MSSPSLIVVPETGPTTPVAPTRLLTRVSVDTATPITPSSDLVSLIPAVSVESTSVTLIADKAVVTADSCAPTNSEAYFLTP
jgi:hypothetical protein